MKAKIVLSTIK